MIRFVGVPAWPYLQNLAKYVGIHNPDCKCFLALNMLAEIVLSRAEVNLISLRKCGGETKLKSYTVQMQFGAYFCMQKYTMGILSCINVYALKYF